MNEDLQPQSTKPPIVPAHSQQNPDEVVARIRASSFSIYDALDAHPELFLSLESLETRLQSKLRGLNLKYPLRTRSKVLKQKVCEALGYSIPKSFSKTTPRFPGQNFDTYVQKANNLQIWNEEVDPLRRYVLIRVDENDQVTRVKVVDGETLSRLDKTGTLTQKYQAKSRAPITQSTLVSSQDSLFLRDILAQKDTPVPLSSSFLPIEPLFTRLQTLEGVSFADPGADQERNRGAALHHLVCEALGNEPFDDSGQFPDIASQLLEIKLQSAATIDLGLVLPSGAAPIAHLPFVRHCDARYAVFYARIEAGIVTISAIILCSGEDFFSFFAQFEGNIVNKKLQIPLPSTFWD